MTKQHEAGAGWAAFVDVYEATMPAVYRYLYRGTGGDIALAEDLTQLTFMAAVRAVRGGRPEALTAAWLHTVARSRLIDHYRRRAREEAKLSVIRGRRADDVDVPGDLLIGEAQAALRALPASQRLVLVLRYLDDLPVAEIASQVGRSVRATESLLARSRVAFRAAYEEHCDV